MNLSFEKWLVLEEVNIFIKNILSENIESPQLEKQVQKVRENLMMLTNKAKFDSNNAIKEIRATNPQNHEKILNLLHSLKIIKKTQFEQLKKNPNQKTIDELYLKTIGVDSSYPEAYAALFKSADIDEFKKNATREMLKLFELDDYLKFKLKKSSDHSWQHTYSSDNFDILGFVQTFVNSFSKIKKDGSWNIDFFNNKSNEEFLKIIRGAIKRNIEHGEMNSYNRIHGKDKTFGQVEKDELDPIKNISKIDPDEDMDDSTEPKVSQEELNKIKNLIFDFYVTDPLNGFVFCANYGIDCQNKNFTFEPLQTKKGNTTAQQIFDKMKKQRKDLIKRYFDGNELGVPGPMYTDVDIMRKINNAIKDSKNKMKNNLQKISPIFANYFQ